MMSPPPPPHEQHHDELGEGDGKGAAADDADDDPPTPEQDEAVGLDDDDEEEEGDEKEKDETKDPRVLAKAAAPGAPIETEETAPIVLDEIIVAPRVASKVKPGTCPSSIPTDGPGVVAVVANTTTMTKTTMMKTTTGIEDMSREEELQQRLNSIEGELRAVTEENKVLRKNNRDLQAATAENHVARRNDRSNRREQPSRSLPSQLIPAFLAGLLGFAPPLLVDVDAVLEWKGWRASFCCCWNRSGDDAAGSIPSSPQQETLHRAEEEDDDGSESGNEDDDDDEQKGLVKTIIHRIKTNLRLPFYVFVSLVDFIDAILDMYVSVQAILENCSSEDDSIKGWALLLFSMTILARLLGGMFGVVYHRIDKSDREVSYFLVEMTIWVMEDMAAVVYLALKYMKGGGLTPSELFSYLFTLACALVFFIPTFCRYKTISKRLSPCAARILFGWCLWNVLWTPFIFFPFLFSRDATWFESMVDAFMSYVEPMWGVLYPTLNAVQLYILFEWTRYLYEKTGSGAAMGRLSERSVPAGGDDLAP